MFIANATVVCSLGHGLRTFAAALHLSEVAKSSTGFGWGKGGNDSSV